MLRPATKQTGFILNSEFILFVSVLVLGLLVGWITLRDAINAELIDTANAIESSITAHYFNDPDRGNGAAFTGQSLEFFEAGASEGLGLSNNNAATNSGSVSAAH